jgi:AsmA family
VRRALQLGGALLVFIVVGTLAVWQVPQWLDWTRYRSQLAILASATLSRPVSINGPISLTLLPQPTLIAAEVAVGGDDSVAVHVDALRLRVALWPLLAGRVDARELVLRGADFSIPWPAGPSAVPPRRPAWLAAFAARIEKGRLTIGNVAITGIDASLETRDTGALSAAGTAQLGGEEWHFVADLTSTGGDGSAGLNVTLDGHGKAAGIGARFSGQFAADGSLAGTLSAGGPNVAVLLPAPAVPFRADGRLTVGGGLAAADELALEIGGSPATGAIALRISPEPRLDIALAAGRLDLDGWLPVLLRAGSTAAGRSLPIGIDISAEAARLGGGTLQRLRAAFELAGDTLHVHQADALLPGDASLDLSGEVARGDPLHPRFYGHVSLNAPVLRTTLQWLRDAVPSLLPNVIAGGEPQRAMLAADVSMSREALSLHGLSGQIDDDAVSGGFDYVAGKPASIRADLTIDQLALDRWIGALLPADLTRVARLADGELRLAVQHASWHGSELGRLSLDAVSAGGNLTLRRLDGGANGTHFMVSGSLAQSGRVSDGRLQISMEQAAGLLPLLPSEWRMTALWQGPLSIEADAAGPPDALALHMRLAVADASLDAQPSFNLRSGEWKASVTLRHPSVRRLAATLGLPARVDWLALPAWLGDGSFALVTHLSGAPSHVQADSFDMIAGDLRADGRLMLEQADEPTVSGRVHLASLSLPVPAAGSAVPLPRAVLWGWHADVQVQSDHLLAAEQPVLQDVVAHVTLADGALRVGEFAGKLAGGKLSGAANYDARTMPPQLMVQATLDGAAVDGPLGVSPIDLMSGKASGGIRIAASGNSPVALISTLSGQVTLGVSDGVVFGFDLFRAGSAARLANRAAAQASASEAATTGSTGFERLDIAAHFAQGELLIDRAALQSAAGEATASGAVSLPDQTIDAMLVLTPALPEPPAIAVRLTGPLDKAKRTPELAGLARWFAERAR